MKAFLRYVAGEAPGDDFTRRLEESVRKARDHVEWRQEYMTYLEHLEKAREEGRAEERIKTQKEKDRADAEKDRADAAESRADAEKKRADTAEREILKLKELLNAAGLKLPST